MKKMVGVTIKNNLKIIFFKFKIFFRPIIYVQKCYQIFVEIVPSTYITYFFLIKIGQTVYKKNYFFFYTPS